jgi:hypothetical protein
MKQITKAKYLGYGSYSRSEMTPFEVEAYNFEIGGCRYHYFHLNKYGKLADIAGLSVGKDIGKWFDIEANITDKMTVQRVKILSAPVASDMNM